MRDEPHLPLPIHFILHTFCHNEQCRSLQDLQDQLQDYPWNESGAQKNYFMERYQSSTYE